MKFRLMNNTQQIGDQFLKEKKERVEHGVTRLILICAVPFATPHLRCTFYIFEYTIAI